jgi:hypothetical protein
LQTIQLIRGQYLKYVKNSNNAVFRKDFKSGQRGMRCGSLVERLSSVYAALGSVPPPHTYTQQRNRTNISQKKT